MSIELKVRCYEGPLNIEVKTTEAAIQAYKTACPLLLVREITNGKFKPEHLDLIKDFLFHSITWTATYTNPTTHAREVIDLWAVEDSVKGQEAEVKAALIHLRNSWPACSKQDREAYVAHSQRNESGLRSLVKNPNDEPLKNLSHDVKHAIENLLPDTLARINIQDPKQRATVRDVFTRRLLFVEQFYSKWTSKIEAAIQAKTQELAAPGLDPQIARVLQGELGELQRLQEELKNLDIYAICKVLLTYPAGGNLSMAELMRLVDRLQQEVSKELLEHVEAEWQKNAGTLAKVRDKLPRADKRTLSAGQAKYAREVALGAILNREDYHQYCTEKKIPKRREGIADLFIREAITFGETLPNDEGKYEPETEYMAEGIQNSVLLKDISAGLKTQLQGELKELGIITTHAIGTKTGDEYETEAPEQYPANADAEQKKAVDDRNRAKRRESVELLKQHVEAHRKRAADNKDLTLEQAKTDWPKPAPTSPLAANPDILDTLLPVPGPISRVVNGGIELLRPNVPPQLVPAFNQFAQRFGSEISLMTALSAGYSFLNSAAPAELVSALGNNAPEFLVQGIQVAQQNPQTFMAVATMLGMMITWTYPAEEKDGAIVRRLHYKRAALALTTVAAGAAAAIRSPEAIAQFFNTSVQFLSSPMNLLNLYGYTTAANQGLSALATRSIAPLVRGALLGGALYLGQGAIAATGNAIAAAGQAVADTALTVINSNVVTSTMGSVAGTIVNAIAPQILVPAAVMGGIYLYSRQLPASVGEVMNQGTARYTSNRIKAVTGMQLGSLVGGATNISISLIRSIIIPLFVLLQYYYALLRK